VSTASYNDRGVNGNSVFLLAPIISIREFRTEIA
jgi:hypothetical protein